MKLPRNRPTGRQAFTLIELMIVIAIIGLLVALISAAVIKGLGLGKQTKNRVEISQLEVAIGQFKQRFGVNPPSQLMLCEKYGQYLDATGNFISPLARDSATFLAKIFPRMVGTPTANPTPPPQPLYLDSTYPWTYNNPNDPLVNNFFIDWNGNGVLDLPVILEGDQCLVFFLGGIPSPCTAGNATGLQVPVANTPPACLGFSTNPRNAAAQTSDRIGPFYEFQTGRLVLIPPTATSSAFRSKLHYSYFDAWGQSDGLGGYQSGLPYAYFSSYQGTNRYNLYVSALNPNGTDCPTLNCPPTPLNPNGLIWPFAEVTSAANFVGTPPPPIRYLNPNSFQIISAGADQLFGPGSQPLFAPSPSGPVFVGFNVVWTQASAPSVYSQQGPNPTGYDDQSNFSGSVLGGGS